LKNGARDSFVASDANDDNRQADKQLVKEHPAEGGRVCARRRRHRDARDDDGDREKQDAPLADEKTGEEVCGGDGCDLPEREGHVVRPVNPKHCERKHAPSDGSIPANRASV
jgi:hypothetical protein